MYVVKGYASCASSAKNSSTSRVGGCIGGLGNGLRGTREVVKVS